MTSRGEAEMSLDIRTKIHLLLGKEQELLSPPKHKAKMENAYREIPAKLSGVPSKKLK